MSIIFFVVCLVLFCFFMLFRAEWVYQRHNEWVEAIYQYVLTIPYEEYERLFNYYDEYLEDYNKSVERFWDWNPDNMIRPDMLETLKRYKESMK